MFFDSIIINILDCRLPGVSLHTFVLRVQKLFLFSGNYATFQPADVSQQPARTPPAVKRSTSIPHLKQKATSKYYLF